MSSIFKRALQNRWVLWLCGCLLAAAFVVWHASAVSRYLDRVTATIFTDNPSDTPLTRIPQAIAADGQVWIRHAVHGSENDTWRLRSSDIDNAPEGRAIYWNSAWALWLSACGRVRMALTNEPLSKAIETASLWANLPIFLLVLGLVSGWVWRRWGGFAGALTAIALVGHRKFYEGFYPAYCDHHGLINTAVLGVVLGALMGGAGKWKRTLDTGASLLPRSEPEVMRAMTVSAVCGALGMWVSAASLVVTIAFTGVAGLLSSVIAGRGKEADIVCVPRAWQRWGRVGAFLSFGLYLLENFPDRLGLRLEANHPLFSLAWWGAGESIAAVLMWKGEARPMKWLWGRALGWGAVVIVAPVVIGMGGETVFAPLNPFLGRIHESIHEFEPLWTTIARVGWAPYRDQLWISFLLLVLFGAWLLRKHEETEKLPLVFIGGLTLASTMLGWYQNRWLLTASASQVLLALVLLRGVTARLNAGARASVLITAAALLYLPGPLTLIMERRHVERVRDVQLGETMQLLYRDIAGALINAGADSRSIVLTNPNASVGVGYYGRFRTVGTLYWENSDGLRAAAEIFGARDEAEAMARIHERGVTHVVMISSYDFLAEYSYALHGERDAEKIQSGFGYKLLYRHRVPVWLRPLGYSVPTPLAGLKFNVSVFAVDFHTPEAIAYERIGLHQLSKGERTLAETSFMASLAADASRAEPWLIQGQLMLADDKLDEALNYIRAGIDRAPEGERARLVRAAAAMFARRGPEGQARAKKLLGTLTNSE